MCIWKLHLRESWICNSTVKVGDNLQKLGHVKCKFENTAFLPPQCEQLIKYWKSNAAIIPKGSLLRSSEHILLDLACWFHVRFNMCCIEIAKSLIWLVLSCAVLRRQYYRLYINWPKYLARLDLTWVAPIWPAWTPKLVALATPPCLRQQFTSPEFIRDSQNHRFTYNL